MIKYLKFFFSVLFSPKYRLSGKCIKCGNCCRNIVFYIGDNPVKTEEDFERIKRFGKSYNHFFPSGRGERGEMLFTCKSLRDDNLCKDYKRRSVGCRIYPKINQKFVYNGGQPLDGCGYEFKVDTRFKDLLK